MRLTKPPISSIQPSTGGATPASSSRPGGSSARSAIDAFNSICPLLAGCDALAPRASDPRSGSKSGGISLYYGVNISPYKEPLEQLDPLLLVGFYNRLLAQSASQGVMPVSVELTVFVAGKYRLLNFAPDRDPRPVYAQWSVEEQRKTALYQKSAVALGLSDAVRVLQTDDLWGDERYWSILCDLFERLPTGGERIFQRESVRFGDIPRDLLGAIRPEQQARLATSPACSLYLHAELAEALYLQQTAGVSAKIGPQTEEEYDRYLRDDLSILQFRSPLDLSSAPDRPRSLIPYIGARDQSRIWIREINPAGLPAQVRSTLEAASDWPGGPLDQWRARLALLASSDAPGYNQSLSALGPLSELAPALSAYLGRVLDAVR